MMVFTAIVTSRSCHLYLKTRELVPGNVESLYEIGFVLLGRKSIYLISSIIFLMCFGLVIIYFIVFGSIASSLSVQLFFENNDSSFFAKKPFYILVLSAFLLPLVLKKEIKELKIASQILFIGVLSFILILLYQMFTEGFFMNGD